MTNEQEIRYIPVPTGNSINFSYKFKNISVYPCTYRELELGQINFTRLSRYIPVPTGNSSEFQALIHISPVYPCTYRELAKAWVKKREHYGISLYLQGTLN